MKKFFILFTFIFCFSVFNFSNVYAEESQKYIRVGLVQKFQAQQSIAIHNKEIFVGFVINGERSILANRTSPSGFNVSSLGSNIVIKSGEEVLFIFDENINPVIWDINENPVKLSSDRSYRGMIEFNQENGGITAINIINVEEYLYSVVSSEMPPTWHIEALKAQAVASRSYTHTRIKLDVHSGSMYDICDTTRCQVYNGFESETESSREAVSSTRGLMAYFEGEVINATYFSSSGGRTETSAHVWQEALPYLKSVDDIFETEGKKWTRTFSLEQIQSTLANRNIDIGTIQSIGINKNSTNRVESLIIIGTNGNHILQKENIRTFFASFSGGLLESRNFTITSQTENSVTFSGQGFGHGVGMSQFGAKGMAEFGFSYQEILKHYYLGITLE